MAQAWPEHLKRDYKRRPGREERQGPDFEPTYIGPAPKPGASLAEHYARGRRGTQQYIRNKLLPRGTKEEFEAWIVKSVPWRFYARQDQLEPDGEWQAWLFQAGRGSGKTRAGSEWTFEQGAGRPNQLVGVLSPTTDDLTRVTFDGPSGLVRLADRHPHLVKAVTRRPWQIDFVNGSKIQSYTGEAYERLRGPQFHAFWADELAGMARVAHLAIEQVLFGLRLGRARLLMTSTPKPLPLFHRYAKRFSEGDRAIRITRATTMDNAANLSPAAINELLLSYDGTRLGKQELYGELLTDVPGSLWLAEHLQQASMPDSLDRIVVAVDPSGASSEKSRSDEIGIVVAGMKRGRTKADDRYYVLEDCTMIGSPGAWGKRAVTAFEQWEADRIVAEGNFGGGMVEATIKAADSNVPVKIVTASRGKAVRAEPVSALYESGRVFHCGRFAKLEHQQINMTSTGYVGEGSPDRVDALVWAITDLMTGARPPFVPVLDLQRVSPWLPS